MEAVACELVFGRRKPVSKSVGTCSMVYVRIFFMVVGICKLVRMSASRHAQRYWVEEFWAFALWKRKAVGGNEVERMRVCGFVEKEAEGGEEFNHSSCDCFPKVRRWWKM